jgi:hypothetical protein
MKEGFLIGYMSPWLAGYSRRGLDGDLFVSFFRKVGCGS